MSYPDSQRSRPLRGRAGPAPLRGSTTPCGDGDDCFSVFADSSLEHYRGGFCAEDRSEPRIFDWRSRCLGTEVSLPTS